MLQVRVPALLAMLPLKPCAHETKWSWRRAVIPGGADHHKIEISPCHGRVTPHCGGDLRALLAKLGGQGLALVV